MKRARGFSLLEVLITLTILSFGLLGVAGIALHSLKGNQSAYTRTQAILLANDIIASMRANRIDAERQPSPYSLPMNAQTTGDGSIPDADLAQWRHRLARQLPEGKGAVTMHHGSQKVRVVVQWMLPGLDRAQPTRQAQGITLETRL
jgi:type IV pilus assembly protein PilV